MRGRLSPTFTFTFWEADRSPGLPAPPYDHTSTQTIIAHFLTISSLPRIQPTTVPVLTESSPFGVDAPEQAMPILPNFILQRLFPGLVLHFAISNFTVVCTPAGN